MHDRFGSYFQSKSHARHEVQVIAIRAAARNAIRPYFVELRRRQRRNKVVHPVFNFSPGPAQEVLVAEAEVEGQPAADFVIVLPIKRKVGLPESESVIAVRECVYSGLGRSKKLICPGQSAINGAEREGTVLVSGLEHVV